MLEKGSPSADCDRPLCGTRAELALEVFEESAEAPVRGAEHDGLQ